MTLLPLLILALIQGITEFLPISSSGHLLLAHHFLKGDAARIWSDDLVIDIAVHVGTLFAVLLYFRKDAVDMAGGGLRILTGRAEGPQARLALQILVASLPVVLVGLVLFTLKPGWMRSVEVVAWATLIFGVLLWVADARRSTEKSVEMLSWRDVLIIGLAQSLALIPGVSRSGITMTAGRFVNLNREESARFSLLLSLVAIAGAGVLVGLDLAQSGDVRLGVDALIAAVLAFGAAWAAIALMMAWLRRASFAPFAIYRIILGLGLLYAIYAEILPRSF